MDNKNDIAACGSAVTYGDRDNTNDKGNKKDMAVCGSAVTCGDRDNYYTDVHITADEGFSSACTPTGVQVVGGVTCP